MMKLNKTRKKFKLWAVASLCLVLILVCSWLAARHQDPASKSNDDQFKRWQPKWGQYEAIDDDANKSLALIYYKPDVRFDEDSVRRLRAETRIEINHSSSYSMQPRNNVIECQQSARLGSDKPTRFDSIDSETTLFIVVNSRFDNFDRRDKLRKSWLKRSNLESKICSSSETPIKKVVWTFVLGLADDAVNELRLHNESKLYGDLLILNTRESYRNLTRKHLATFKWLLEQRRHYSSTGREVLLKCDDDAQLDLGQLIETYSLERAPANQRQDLLMCARFRDHSRVLRHEPNGKTTKWSLTRQEWPYDTFPGYCSGLAYLANLELVEKLFLVSKLVSESSQVNALWIDDVYVTGVLLAALKLNDLKLVKLNPLFCFTEAQRQHRESLNPAMKCLASEEAS